MPGTPFSPRYGLHFATRRKEPPCPVFRGRVAAGDRSEATSMMANSTRFHIIWPSLFPADTQPPSLPPPLSFLARRAGGLLARPPPDTLRAPHAHLCAATVLCSAWLFFVRPKLWGPHAWALPECLSSRGLQSSGVLLLARLCEVWVHMSASFGVENSRGFFGPALAHNRYPSSPNNRWRSRPVASARHAAAWLGCCCFQVLQ